MKKILSYLIYLFIFLLPWQTRWIFYDPKINGEAWEYGRMSIYSFDIIFLVLVIFYLILLLFSYKCESQKSIFKNRLCSICLDPRLRGDDKKERGDDKRKNEDNKEKNLKLFITHYSLLTAFFIFLNILFAQNTILTLYWWLRVAEILLFLWILKSLGFLGVLGDTKRIKMAWAFILSMVLSVGLGIYQFLTQSVFESKWLGLAVHKASDLGASVVEISNGERFLRAYGSLPHPNVLAGFILATLLLLVIGQTREMGQRKIKWRNYFFAFVLVVGLFFTFSRAAWLAGGLLGLIGFIGRTKGIRQTGRITVMCFCVFVFLCFAYWPLVQTRFGLGQAPARLETQSVSERISNYQEAWQIIKNSPLTGVGFGNYTFALQKNNSGLPGFKYQPVHNVFALVLAELGIFGIFGIFYFVWKNLQFTIYNLRKYNLVFSTFLFFSVFMLLCSDHYFWTLPSAMILALGGLGFFGKKMMD